MVSTFGETPKGFENSKVIYALSLEAGAQAAAKAISRKYLKRTMPLMLSVRWSDCLNKNDRVLECFLSSQIV